LLGVKLTKVKKHRISGRTPSPDVIFEVQKKASKETKDISVNASLIDDDTSYKQLSRNIHCSVYGVIYLNDNIRTRPHTCTRLANEQDTWL